MTTRICLAIAALLGLGGIANGLMMLAAPMDWYFAVPGVTSTGPWPIETEIVSPGYQRWWRTFSLQALSGTLPLFSPSMSMPVVEPRPNSRAYLAILSIPIFWPSV